MNAVFWVQASAFHSIIVASHSSTLDRVRSKEHNTIVSTRAQKQVAIFALLNRITSVQECNATGVNRSDADQDKKIQLVLESRFNREKNYK